MISNVLLVSGIQLQVQFLLLNPHVSSNFIIFGTLSKYCYLNKFVLLDAQQTSSLLQHKTLKQTEALFTRQSSKKRKSLTSASLKTRRWGTYGIKTQQQSERQGECGEW